ncbi:conjugal transfer protein, partial [Escherichia coli]|nr:conjugal transfer protein [Escherichia coli]
MPKLLPLTGLLLAVLSGQVLAESTGTPGTSAQGSRGSVPATPISGTAPLPGLSPAAQEAAALDSPLTPDEIRELAKRLQATEQALAAPVTSVVPRISSLTVSLSPGASLPVLRLALNNASTVTFQDSTGAPWPLAAPPMNPNEHLFQINYIPDSPVFSVLPRTAWASGNVTVLLKGLEVPVIISLTSGDPDSDTPSREIDARLDLRIPRQGPQAAAGPTPPARVALHDETL